MTNIFSDDNTELIFFRKTGECGVTDISHFKIKRKNDEPIILDFSLDDLNEYLDFISDDILNEKKFNEKFIDMALALQDDRKESILRFYNKITYK